MQVVLRYLPQALIIIALAVIVVVVVRKLPKTAKLEAELAAQKAAETAGGVAASKKKRTLPPIVTKVAPGLRAVGRGIAKGSRSAGKVIGNVVVRGRLKEVLSIAARKRKKQMVSASKIASKSESELTEKEQAILQLLREAEDYTRQSNWAAAEKVYIKVVALAPKTIEAYLGLGDLYLKQKNWSDAVESYKVALEGDDENVTAWGNLGLALANKGEWVAAVDALKRAATLDPGNATRQATLGMAYMTVKDFKKATKAYREAVNHDRENMSHRVELATAANLSGDNALAEEMLNAVLARDPLNERAKALLAEVKSKKDLE